MSEPVETVAEFTIRRTGYLDAEGRATGALPSTAGDRDFLVGLYRGMVLTRKFDEKAVALQRTGRLGTFASSLGEEAVGVGLAAAMRPEDVLLPSFREQAAQLWRGVTPEEMFEYWGGSERGSNFTGPREDFPNAVPVGTQYPHAAGVALAFKLRKQPRVAVAAGGDGSTSKGDFYEALNFAGVWNLPVVFVIANNQWAISVPRGAQSAAETLAQKAIAAGIQGEQVDGNDVLAVHDVAAQALERARNGEGPSLIEAITYRITDHTTADDARRYRKDADVSGHWKAEPILRLRNFLVSEHGWAKADEEALLTECRGIVEAAAESYLNRAPEPVEQIFEHQYAELPADLVAQRAEMLSLTEEQPDG